MTYNASPYNVAQYNAVGSVGTPVLSPSLGDTLTFASLVPKINPSVPGCPQPTMVQYIRDAAIRVCERSLAWRWVEPRYNLLPGISEYLYNKPADTEVHAVFDAMMNDAPLRKLTLEQALYEFPYWANLYSGVDQNVIWQHSSNNLLNNQAFNSSQLNQNQGTDVPDEAVAEGTDPVAICQVTPDKYVVLPLPDKTKAYTMRMVYALKPKRTATGMSSVMLNELEDVIVHNALQHLLVLPNTNWSDRELAAYHAKQYIFHLSERRARANMGNMRGTMTVAMRRFGV
jgi:hypothetical protein